VASPRGTAEELQPVCCEQAGVLHQEHPCCEVERAEGLGVKAGKERQRARVKGLDGEVESGSDDTKFAGFSTWVRG